MSSSEESDMEELEVSPSPHPARGLSVSISMSDTEAFAPSSSSRFNIPLREFREYVRDVLETTNDISFDGYDEEMEELYKRCSSADLDRCIHPNTFQISRKNRYVNVLPYSHSRVRLLQLGSDTDSDYINANFIRGDLDGSSCVYISTQAPVPQSVVDFWRMVWEQRSSIIVMLTALRERDRVKSDAYWLDDPEHQPLRCGHFDVRLIDRVKTNDIIHRKFELTNRDDNSQVPRRIEHIQYVGWPDHGVPEEFSSFDRAMTKFRSLREERTGPVIVHCSAGIGRSGTFIAIDILIDNLRHVMESTSVDTSTLNVFDCVYHLRTQRPGMVQTKSQYRFIYNFIDHCFANSRFGLKIS